MSCDSPNAVPIRLGGRPDGPIIGRLVRARDLAVFPVKYRYLFWECGSLAAAKVPEGHRYSWTLDADTLRHYGRGFSIMEFHLTHRGVSIPFLIARDTFIQTGHSSFDCDNKQKSEKWHSPWAFWQYDHEIVDRYPPPERAVQGALL